VTPQKRRCCFKEQGKKNFSVAGKIVKQKEDFSQFFKPSFDCFKDRLETVFVYFASRSAFLDSKVSDSK